ncbi:hypothetical protein KEM56_001882 [Ascosphaera pollenicola]|nr:hypothetical protein KEM56_001882 [Ascosphaera pollenicola]
MVSLLSQDHKNDADNMGDPIDRAGLDRATIKRLESRNAELEAQMRALTQTVAALRPDAIPMPADATAPNPASIQEFMKNCFGSESSVTKDIRFYQDLWKTIPTPPSLQGSANFDQWAECIRLHADMASISKFLDTSNSKRDNALKQVYWDMCDRWLFSHIWSSVSAPAKKRINSPAGCTAAVLFELLSGAFEERSDAKFFKGLSSFLQETVHSDKPDATYFKYMLTTRSVLHHMAVLPDEFWFNCLRMAVSPAAQKYLQERLDATFDADDQTLRPDKNLDKFAIQFKAYLL